MRLLPWHVASVVYLSLTLGTLRCEINVAVEQADSSSTNRPFTFQKVPTPSRNDAATKAKFVLVDGVLDENSGDLDRLHDGQLPKGKDEPDENFYFRAGTDGGRLLVDLGKVITVQQVNTYSWHPGSRAPQVYALYASDGEATGFDRRPKKTSAPEKCGWTMIASVDTRIKYEMTAGQYGVSISDTKGAVGNYRYLLFVISRTEAIDDFGNTFYSEIDVVDRDAPEPPQPAITTPALQNLSRTFTTDDGKCQITINPSAAPDLANWSFKELAPVAQEWYPKITKLLAGENFQAPTNLTIDFRNSGGGNPAATRRDHITCNTGWFRQNLRGEAKGCVVHELVHVVQHYRGGSPPGWLVEGIADYVRWFVYEPQRHGAQIRKKSIPNARYDASYRVTANFLKWTTDKYDKDLVHQLNEALRERNYTDELWRQLTGHTVAELNEEWKKWLDTEAAAE